MRDECPAGRAPYAGGGHFMTCESFAWFERCSARDLVATGGSGDAKPNTSHEVTAPRAGGPSGGHGLVVSSDALEA
jgi:hypothetical protein